jgi:hypothetical protein
MAKLAQERKASLEDFYEKYDEFITKFITTALINRSFGGNDSVCNGSARFNKEDIEDIKHDFYMRFFSSTGRVKKYYKETAEDSKDGKVYCRNCKYFSIKGKFLECNHASNDDRLQPLDLNVNNDCKNFEARLRYKWFIDEDFKGKDYLQIYDHKKSKFTTFLINLLKNHIKNFFQKSKWRFFREKSDKCLSLKNVHEAKEISFSESFSKDSAFDNDVEKEMVMKEQLLSISKKLLTDGLSGFVWVGKGRMVDRGLLNVWLLLREGYSKQDIAKMLCYSPSRISQMIKELRSFKEVIDYKSIVFGS